MMGSTKDPADGKAVAGSVFAAVVVYAVCLHSIGIFGWSFRRCRNMLWLADED